jgi:hypothetical protein
MSSDLIGRIQQHPSTSSQQQLLSSSCLKDAFPSVMDYTSSWLLLRCMDA